MVDSASVSQTTAIDWRAWRYAVPGKRDLRIDMLRGIALVMMVVAHTEILSLVNIFTWERFGLTTGAEGFVILSGFMLGMLNRQRLQKEVLLTIGWTLWRRAAKIYLVNLTIILLILALNRLSVVNTFEVTHFVDRYSGTVWALFPTTPQIKETWFNIVLYLQIGPHQTQILGLYICLLLVSPLFLGLLQSGRVVWLLLASLAAYISYQFWSTRLTVAEFEFAFPLLAWQLIFVCGMCCGWYKDELMSLARMPPGRVVMGIMVIYALVMMFIAQNHTNPFMPPALLLHVIPPADFNWFYHHLAGKNALGPCRVLNDFCLMLLVYLLLTFFWQPVERLFGWFLIPLGQHSLYTFIVHVFVVLAVSQFVHFDLWHHAWLRNTFIHLSALGLLWWMAKKEIGGRFIPN